MVKIQVSSEVGNSFLQKFNKKIQKLEKQVPYMAYVYAVISNVSIVLLQVNLKITTAYIHPFHALALRGFFLLVFNSLFIYWTPGSQLNIKSTSTFKIILKRIAFSALTVALFLGPIKYLPAGNTNAIFNTAPIIVCFIEYFKYNKKLKKNHFILVCLSFIGILLVTQPQFIFGQSNSQYQEYKFLMIFTFIAAITNSFSMTYLHDLKGRLSGLVSLQYFYIGQCLFNNLLLTTQHINFQQIQIDRKFFIGLILLVIFSYSCQSFTTKAMMLKKPSYIMPFGYICIILSAIIDVVYFNHQLNFLSIVGMILTGSGLLIKVLIPQDDRQKSIKVIPNNFQNSAILSQSQNDDNQFQQRFDSKSNQILLNVDKIRAN